MGFRDEFWLTNKTYAEWSLENTTKDGFRANEERLKALQKGVKSTFEQGIDRLARSQAESSVALQGELAYQAERINEQIAQSSSAVVSAVEQGTSDIVESIQQMSDYLGSELCEVRWAVERHTQVSQDILQVLLNSLDNQSRQYFEQGVRCYETSEYDFAKERFSKALESNRTNYFAYQYLGFVAVTDDKSDEAIRNFELARKFASSSYHQALALSHLARSNYALGDVAKAVDLSEGAVKTHPETAKFWYELAAYCARVGRKGQAVSALQQAIERDWTYWAVVASDPDFDVMRAEVNRLLDELREREKGKAGEALTNLKRAIDTARQAGVKDELSTCVTAFDRMKKDFQRNNVYLFREIVPKANKWHEQTFQIAIREIQQTVPKHKERINNLDSFINALELERSSLAANFKPWKPHWLVYLIMWVVIPVPIAILFVDFTKRSIRYGKEESAAVLIAILLFPIILLIPFFINRFRKQSRVTTAQANLSRQIRLKKSEVEPQRREIERDVEKLTGYLESLRRNEYL